MAKISLRLYNREIETMIDEGRIEEAIAHCHHILKTFPKHLETYRLLGKAYLEAKRYHDAADIFQRVLMSVPDDFIAHAGMSLVNDEQGNLDAAIWHMERAFEAQPANAAVQSELQRLYGRRDGVEPPKIRMTRGALAHMYVQGELYPQAIGEIRGVLAEEPDRADMQTLLAKTYFLAGQSTEALEIASTLLKKYPYSFDANRILVEILPQTSRAESTQAYRHRVNSLDPYAAFAKSSVFYTEEVPDAAISLERLEWDGSPIGGLGTDWGRTMGIRREDEFASAAPAQPEPSEFSPKSEGGGEEIPEWMKAAGWTESSGAAEEPPPAFDTFDDLDEAEGAEGEISQADLPDWIKSMAPPEAEVAEQEAGLDDSTPPDSELEKLLGALPQENAASPIEDESLPDWLQGSAPEEETPGEPVPAAPADDLGTKPEEQDEALAWLESLAAKQGAKSEELLTTPEERSEDVPEWVQEAARQEDSAPKAEEPAQPEPPTAESVVESQAEAEIPEWLQSESEPAAQVEIPPAESPVEKAAEEAIPNWLKDIENPAPAVPSEGEELPAWLREESETPVTPPKPTHPSDWKPVAQTSEAASPEAERIPAQEVTPPPEEKKPAPKPKPPVRRASKRMNTTMLRDITLSSARAALREGNIPAALKEYKKLIKRNKLLEEVIYDLREALYQYPVDVTIWETLGQAYTRSNRLQDALDAYTKAEELLR